MIRVCVALWVCLLAALTHPAWAESAGAPAPDTLEHASPPETVPANAATGTDSGGLIADPGFEAVADGRPLQWELESPGGGAAWALSPSVVHSGATALMLKCTEVASPTPDNFVTNGDFEQVNDSGAVLGWRANHSQLICSDQPASGEKAVQVVPQKEGKGLQVRTRIRDAQALLGRRVRLTAQIQIEGADTKQQLPRMGLLYQVDGKEQIRFATPVLRANWQSLTVSATIPDQAAPDSVFVVFSQSFPFAGRLWLDAVSLVLEPDMERVPDHAGPARVVSAPFTARPGDTVDFAVWAYAKGRPQGAMEAWLEVRRGSAWEPLAPRCAVRRSPGKWREERGYSIVVPGDVSQARFVVGALPYGAGAASYVVDDCRAWVSSSFQDYAATHRNSERLPDIVLAGVDTLRQDRLGCYGNTANYTPTVDQWAREGRLYGQVTTACSWTKPSFASIFTSLYPSQHHVETPANALSQDFVTLAELLREKGYFTAGFAYTRPDGYLGARMGMTQGFDSFFQSTDEEEVSEAFLTFLKSNAPHMKDLAGGGIFLFFHNFEPHSPYTNRNKALVRNEGHFGTVDITNDEHLRGLKHGFKRGIDYTDQDVAYIRQVYDWEVIYLDTVFSSLVRVMKWCGLYDELNIVLCSDHGEAFGELPKQWGHGMGWETVVRTPLVLRLPGRVAPGEVDRQTLVSNLDILPTLLSVAGVAVPDNVQGVSLLTDPTAAGRQYAVSETRLHGWVTARNDRYKLVIEGAAEANEHKPYGMTWTFQGPASKAKRMLFDLQEDIFEQKDLASEKPEVAESLYQALLRHCEAVGITGQGTDNAVEEVISTETKEELKALGYF